MNIKAAAVSGGILKLPVAYDRDASQDGKDLHALEIS
jgi:hypothetical protein